MSIQIAEEALKCAAKHRDLDLNETIGLGILAALIAIRDSLADLTRQLEDMGADGLNVKIAGTVRTGPEY